MDSCRLLLMCSIIMPDMLYNIFYCINYTIDIQLE